LIVFYFVSESFAIVIDRQAYNGAANLLKLSHILKFIPYFFRFSMIKGVTLQSQRRQKDSCL